MARGHIWPIVGNLPNQKIRFGFNSASNLLSSIFKSARLQNTYYILYCICIPKRDKKFEDGFRRLRGSERRIKMYFNYTV